MGVRLENEEIFQGNQKENRKENENKNEEQKENEDQNEDQKENENQDENKNEDQKENENQNPNKKVSVRKYPSIAEVSVLFTMVFVLFIVFGSRAQRLNLYGGLVFTEIVLIMAPAILFLMFKRYNIKKVLRLNRVSFISLIIIFCIMLFSLPIIGSLNYVNLALIKLIFGKAIINQPAAAIDMQTLIINLLIIAVSAGICEETLFRGLLQRSYEKMGVVKGLLMTSLLFAFLHVDFQKMLYTFVLGVLIGYIVYKTHSLYAGMFAHFCNNGIAVVLAFGAEKLKQIQGMNGIESTGPGKEVVLPSLAGIPQVQLIMIIIFYLFIFGICASVVIAMLIALHHHTKRYDETRDSVQEQGGRKGLLWVLPAVGFVFVIFYVQGLSLMGQKAGFLTDIIRVIVGK